MDIQQLLPILAQSPPPQRIAIAQQIGITPEQLFQIEQAILSAGLPLNGGSCFEGLTKSMGDSGEYNEKEDDEVPDEEKPSLLDAFQTAKENIVKYGGMVLFLAAIPTVVYIMKERRALGWRQLAESWAKLPFSD